MKKIILAIACIMLCACASTKADFDLDNSYECYIQRQKAFENVNYEYHSLNKYKSNSTDDEQDDIAAYENYSSGYTYVRGHYRYYKKSGKVTYVKPYYRRK